MLSAFDLLINLTQKGQPERCVRMRLKPECSKKKVYLLSRAVKENFLELSVSEVPVTLFWKVKFCLVVSTQLLCIWRCIFCKTTMSTSHCLCFSPSNVIGEDSRAHWHRSVTFSLHTCFNRMNTGQRGQRFHKEHPTDLQVNWLLGLGRDAGFDFLFSAKKFLTYKRIWLTANKILCL